MPHRSGTGAIAAARRRRDGGGRFPADFPDWMIIGGAAWDKGVNKAVGGSSDVDLYPRLAVRVAYQVDWISPRGIVSVHRGSFGCAALIELGVGG
jgi:hypothetical protein